MKKIFAVFAFFVIVFSAFADKELVSSSSDAEFSKSIEKELTTILNADTAKKLVEKGKILVYKYNESDMQAQLAPNLNVLTKMKASLNPEAFKPVFLMESLYLFKKTDCENSVNSDIAKILKSISKLQGLEYYSNSRKKMRTLYAESFVVKKTKDDASEYERVPDPIDAETEGLSILACQRDLTFGKYIYRYDYFIDDGAIGTVCTNTENLYKIFKLISKENLKVGLVIKEYKDFVLVYCSTRARFAKFSWLRNKLVNSFSSRADAMYNWFIGEYKKSCVDKKGE